MVIKHFLSKMSHILFPLLNFFDCDFHTFTINYHFFLVCANVNKRKGERERRRCGKVCGCSELAFSGSDIRIKGEQYWDSQIKPFQYYIAYDVYVVALNASLDANFSCKSRILLELCPHDIFLAAMHSTTFKRIIHMTFLSLLTKLQNEIS